MCKCFSKFDPEVVKLHFMEGAQIIQPLSMLDPFGDRPNSWIGRSIGDRQRYRLDRCLGIGCMGYVFLARDTLLGKQVALKLLRETLVTSLELRQRFKNEVRVCAALESDHIVGVSDYGETAEGLPFYVMEYLRGQSLGQLLHQQRQLPVERAVNIITQVCDGLSLAHKGVNFWRETATVSEHIQVIHRDLKPDNIFLVPTVSGESVKILDFGIAKIQEKQEYAELTNIDTFVGTYHYAAPEQLEGANIDGRADIYSLGIILYEMFSGTDPFGLGLNTRKISESSWMVAHTNKPVQPLRSQPGLSNLSPLLEVVVLKCLAKSPSDRFKSVDDLKIALQVATEPDTVLPPIPIQYNSEDKTTLRPLTPLLPEVTKSTNRERTIEQVESVDLEVSETILSSEKDSLLEILTEIIGPMAPALIEKVVVQASSIKELVNKLLPYLSSAQQKEIKEKTILPQVTTQTKSIIKHTQLIDDIFLQECKAYLTEIIGPIASSLIQDSIKSHPQISSVDLLNVIAKKIPNPKQAKEFLQHFKD